ncbi:MAG: efflux RND transporter periplasmic adaptor subunit [Chitinophagaceae bacterium]|nr:efflux RND transporter periplasmic adaptor subunit [Chitinophagaceae bacterium]
MNRLFQLLTLGSIAVLASCKNGNGKYDASGTFEANEVIVSSELSGKILSFTVEEGQALTKDTIVGTVDAASISLQKEQVEASVAALSEKTADVSPAVKLLENQLEVQKVQLDNLLHEYLRIDRLVKMDAATSKQLDDIKAQVDVAKKNINVTAQQINVQKNNVATQNRSILSEGKPLQKRVAQLDDQLKKASIINPIAGTVITKYAEPGEITTAGKALYKIADLSTMTLRAYVTGSQLTQIKLGQAVKVLVDDGPDKYREIPGIITWISDKAEFTPKTIQTKYERANLVYATKIKVKNDGYIKIGMYGEVKF